VATAHIDLVDVARALDVGVDGRRPIDAGNRRGLDDAIARDWRRAGRLG
jgi:hypothetical protein